jgi:hypothetical protein
VPLSELRKTSTRFVMSVCLSVRMKQRLPLDGFSWNIFECFSKIRLQMKINTGNVRISVTQARLHNHCCHWKALSITYSECVYVASVIQHAVHMHPIILTSVTCLPYFRTFCYKGYDLRTNFTEQKMWIFIFSAAFVCNTFRDKNSAIYHKCAYVFM